MDNSNNRPELTVKLYERQRFLDMTDDEFGAYLGIGSDTWTKIKGMRSNYGGKTLIAVLNKFPEYLEYVRQLKKQDSHSAK